MPLLDADSVERAIAIDDQQLDPDLMYAKFILCHEGANANGDYFTKEVLQAAHNTPINKPIDWEHGQPIIGTMLNSKYAEDATGRGYIEAEGVMWKFIYPELSSEIKAKSATGELRLSMECYYRETDATYKVGDNLYTSQQAKDLGLTQYVGREYMGNKVLRVFSQVIFGGVGVVANPADKEAVFLSVAKDLSNHNNSEVDSKFAEIMSAAIKRSINDFTNKTHDSEVIDSVTVAKYVKAFDKAKSSIVSKFNKDQLKTKEQTLSEIRSIMSTFASELSVIGNQYYKGVASDNVDIEQSVSTWVKDNYAEAYLLEVAEDYFIYELIDYSNTYPDSIKLMKGYYSIENDAVVVDLEKAVEVLQAFVEKNPSESEEEAVMSQANKEVEELEVVEATEEVVEAVEAAEVVEETVDATDYKAMASDLQSTIASLTAELDTVKAEKGSLAEKLATAEAKLDEIEKNTTAQARLSELKEAGIEFNETRLEKEIAKLKSMTPEQYADYKELLVEVASTKKVETVDEVVEAEASEEVEEEITVEGAKATIELNIELDTNRAEVKPFSHLNKKSK